MTSEIQKEIMRKINATPESRQAHIEDTKRLERDIARHLDAVFRMNK